MANVKSSSSRLHAVLAELVHSKYRWLHFALLSIVVLLVLTSPYRHRVSDLLNQHNLIDQNAMFLENRESEARDAILILGGLKGLYLTLASSQVGISFILDTQVTVGQLFAPFIDKIDAATEMFMVSFGTIYFLKEVNSHSDSLSWFLAVLSLAISALYFVLRYIEARWSLNLSSTKFIAGTGRKVFYLFLFFYLFVPYAIHGSALVFHHYTKELKMELHQDIKNLYDEASSKNQESFRQRGRYVLGKFAYLEHKVKQKIDTMSRYVVQHWVFWFIELLPLLIIPLTFVLIVRSETVRRVWIPSGIDRA